MRVPKQEQRPGIHGWGLSTSMEFAVDATRAGISAQHFPPFQATRLLQDHGKDLPLFQPALKVGKRLVQGSHNIQAPPATNCLGSCKSFFEL